MRFSCPLIVALCVGLTPLAGCKRKTNVYAPPPPPEVTVSTPIERIVPDTIEFTGRTRGIDAVEVRARVKGFLQKKHVDGGQRVKAGDLLFTIDPREYEAIVRQAQAELESAKSTLALAELKLERVKDAFGSQAAAQFELDQATAERDQQKAAVGVSEAKLAQSKLDLEFTQVKAPVGGRLSIVTIDEGQLVGASEPTLLATVINDSKLYATYDMDERQLLAVRTDAQNKRPGEDGRPNLVVKMALADEVGFPHIGSFDKADNTVDPQTGTIRIEAVFDNPDGALLPGLFVRLQSVMGERKAMLVPDVCVQMDPNGRFVLVVNNENVVERRNVTVGPVIDHMRRIDDGLEAGARVVVNGLQRARPGTTVTPKPVATGAASTASNQPPAAAK